MGQRTGRTGTRPLDADVLRWAAGGCGKKARGRACLRQDSLTKCDHRCVWVRARCFRPPARDCHRGSDRFSVRARAAGGGQRPGSRCEERAALIDGQLAERFQALSAQALDASTATVPRSRGGTAAGGERHRGGRARNPPGGSRAPHHPAAGNPGPGGRSVRQSDEARTPSHAALAEQVAIARQSSEQLRTQTQALVTALRRPEARGRWGELQLRRVVELAGMSARCDFDEQVTSADGTQRPDMVVRLAGGKNIVVDSKVSLAAYLEAAESDDEAVRAARVDAHARHLREHVDRLAGKAYWAALSPSPEFVILFIPGEAFLAPALERDPGLLEHAMARKVHIATPTTLVTMLRTAQYAWQQAALADNARAVFDLGRELYDRLGSLGRNVDQLGRALTKTVSAYNQTVGSLESRVLVRARRLNDLGVVDGELTRSSPSRRRPGRCPLLSWWRRPRGDQPRGDQPGGDSTRRMARRPRPAGPWAWCARLDDADPCPDAGTEQPGPRAGAARWNLGPQCGSPDLARSQPCSCCASSASSWGTGQAGHAGQRGICLRLRRRDLLHQDQRVARAGGGPATGVLRRVRLRAGALPSQGCSWPQSRPWSRWQRRVPGFSPGRRWPSWSPSAVATGRRLPRRSARRRGDRAAAEARSSRGRVNVIFSSTASTSSTVPKPQLASLPSTAATSSSGTEAPLVTPTVVTPSSQPSSTSPRVVDQVGRRAVPAPPRPGGRSSRNSASRPR